MRYLLAGLLIAGAVPAHGQPVPRLDEVGTQLNVRVHTAVLVRSRTPIASVFVADPEIADVRVRSEHEVYVYGRALGTTTVFILDSNGRTLVAREVVISHDVKGLEQALERNLPNAQISVSTVGDRLLVSGTVEDPGKAKLLQDLALGFVDAESLVNNVRVTSPTQVNLRVRIAEISRSARQSLGINWQGSSFRLSDNSALSLFGIENGSVSNPFALGISASGKNLDLNALIDALEEEGVMTILAEPNLTARSGESAEFLAGGEFPYPVPQGVGGENVTISFRQYGISLKFTPTVLDDQSISLRITPEVSELSEVEGIEVAGVSVPGVITRRASTSVELRSGESFAIAGLLRSSTAHDVNKFPGLGSLPIIGGLFRSQSYKQGTSELIIVVTPYLVQPVAGEIVTPLHGLGTPSATDRLLLGTTEAPSNDPTSALFAERDNPRD